jgi:hypothetical protein
VVRETEELSEKEQQEARALLQDQNFLLRFLDDIGRLGCAGEEENKITLYLALTSRKLDEPIDIVVKGDSSGGKSFLVERVAEFHPREEVLQFTWISAKALLYRPDDLSHKAIIIYEKVGSEQADYSIRTIQSEKKLRGSTVEMNAKTGRFETRDVEVSGPVAFIETTTKGSLHPENATRVFDLRVDESEEQTEAIFAAQDARHMEMEIDREALLRPWRNAQRLVKSYPVIIPFVERIRFPTRPLRVRRDRPRFLALIEASCLLHQFQRNKKIINGTEYLVATPEDYGVAYRLAHKILGHSLKGTTPQVEWVVKTVMEMTKEDPSKTFTCKDLRSWLGCSRPTAAKHVNAAIRSGYIEFAQKTEGTEHRYRLVREWDEEESLLISPEELAAQLGTALQPANLSTAVKSQVLRVKPLNLEQKVEPVKGVKGSTEGADFHPPEPNP